MELSSGISPNSHPSPPPTSNTTFVQADSSSFKQVVQMLTGSNLYQRRKSFRNTPFLSDSPRPAKPTEVVSPSILDFPSLLLSPVTPLLPDPFNHLDTEAEDKAIKEKGFYLHPSPANTEPRLLPLFPLTSPTLSDSSNALTS